MINRAQKLFYSYDGNHGAMANDGVYDEYKSFDIPKSMEQEWLSEIQKCEFEKLADTSDLKRSFAKLCSIIQKTKDNNALDLLSELFFDERFSEHSVESRVYMCATFVDTLLVFQQNEVQDKNKSLVIKILKAIREEKLDSEILCKLKLIDNKLSKM